MSPTASRILRYGVTIFILVMLVLFARRIDWPGTWNTMRAASPSVLVLAAGLNVASLAVKGVRWWIFLRPVGVRSLPLTMRATFAGAGLNNILVANGGDAARVVFVTRGSRATSAEVLGSVALDRLFDIVGWILFVAAAAVFLPLPPGLARARPYAVAALAASVAFLWWLIRRPGAGAPAAASAEAPIDWRSRIKRYAAHFARTVGTVSTTERFGAALLLSVAAWMLQVFTYHETARAAHFPITVTGTIAALLAVNLGFAVKATPGNVGVFQAIYAATAVAFGLSATDAVGVALLIQAQQIVIVTAIGVALAPEFILRRS